MNMSPVDQKIIRLYSKDKIDIPPRSEVYTPLMAKHIEKLEDGYDVIVEQDIIFQNRKSFIKDLISLNKKENLVNSCANVHDTWVTINKREIVAKASFCDQ